MYIVHVDPSEEVLTSDRVHSFPFSVFVPQYVPSSFEGRYGSVRWWLECNVERSWKFDYKCKKPITVHAVYDLNCMPNATVSCSTDSCFIKVFSSPRLEYKKCVFTPETSEQRKGEILVLFML